MRYRRNSPGAIKWVGFGLLASGLICGTISLCAALRTRHFQKIAEHVPGTVIELQERYSKKSSTTYAPVFQFTDKAGAPHTIVSNTSSSPPAYTVGQAVDVLYDPKDIEGAEINGRMVWFGSIITGVIGAIHLTIGLVFVVVWRVRQALK